MKPTITQATALKKFIFLNKKEGNGVAILSNEKPTRFKRPKEGWSAEVIPQRKSFKTTKSLKLTNLDNLTYVGYFPSK